MNQPSFRCFHHKSRKRLNKVPQITMVTWSVLITLTGCFLGLFHNKSCLNTFNEKLQQVALFELAAWMCKYSALNNSNSKKFTHDEHGHQQCALVNTPHLSILWQTAWHQPQQCIASLQIFTNAEVTFTGHLEWFCEQTSEDKEQTHFGPSCMLVTWIVLVVILCVIRCAVSTFWLAAIICFYINNSSAITKCSFRLKAPWKRQKSQTIRSLLQICFLS